VNEPISLPINEPAKVIGDTTVLARVDDRTVEIHLAAEPEEDILLLGLMMQEVGLMQEMLRNLHKGPVANYRSNLYVCRGACERLKARCTRLLGDGVEAAVQNGRSSGEKSTVKRTSRAK